MVIHKQFVYSPSKMLNIDINGAELSTWLILQFVLAELENAHVWLDFAIEMDHFEHLHIRLINIQLKCFVWQEKMEGIRVIWVSLFWSQFINLYLYTYDVDVLYLVYALLTLYWCYVWVRKQVIHELWTN